MVESTVLSHLDLDSSRMQPIDVIRPGQLSPESARIETIFIRLGQQTHGYAARQRSQQRVADADVSHAIHRQIYFLCLLIDLRDRPCRVVLCSVLIRQEVDSRIDWMSRVLAR